MTTPPLALRLRPAHALRPALAYGVLLVGLALSVLGYLAAAVLLVRAALSLS